LCASFKISKSQSFKSKFNVMWYRNYVLIAIEHFIEWEKIRCRWFFRLVVFHPINVF
jgi:hypothetical protein